MELWNLLVSFFANIPLYYQTNRNLFLVTLGVVLVYSGIVLFHYLVIARKIGNPIAKAGYVLVAAIGAVSLITSGIAFVSVQEIAELRPEILTRPLFAQLAVVGLLRAGINAAALVRRGEDMESTEVTDVFKNLLKGGFVTVWSLLGAFVGPGLASWGFSLFGKTLGNWIFGAYLAWATASIFSVLGFVVQGPLVLLFGNPDQMIEDAIDSSLESIFDEFEGNKPGQRNWKGVIIPAAVVLAVVVGLGIARNAYQDVATVPEQLAAAEASEPEAAAQEETPAAPAPADIPEGMPADHVMDWGDPVLEQYIREQTGIAEGDIWLHDVWDLEALYLAVQPNENNVIEVGPRITDASALAELTNLRELSLMYQSVDDLSFVASLPHLEVLNIQMTPVSDLSPLASCASLQWLLAGYTDVYDLSPISGLPNLSYVYVNNTRVTSVEPLRGMTGLTHVNLVGDDIEDLSPLDGLDLEELRLS